MNAIILTLLLVISSNVSAHVYIFRDSVRVSKGAIENITEGTDLTFTCTIGNPNKTVALRIANNSTSLVIDEDPLNYTRTFTIFDLNRANHNTSFTCNDDHSSSYFSINVQYPPDLEFANAQYYGLKGGELSIGVSVQANPMSTDFSWWKDGMEFVDTNDIMTTSNSIMFNILDQSDAGTYTLLSINDIGNGSATFELTVYYEIEFAEGGNGTTLYHNVSSGDQFTINCTLSSPNPSTVDVYILMPDGTRVNSTVYMSQASQNSEGMYTCVASTVVQTVRLTYSITVIGVTPATTSTGPMPTSTTSPSPTPSSGYRYSVSLLPLVLALLLLALI